MRGNIVVSVSVSDNDSASDSAPNSLFEVSAAEGGNGERTCVSEIQDMEEKNRKKRARRAGRGNGMGMSDDLILYEMRNL